MEATGKTVFRELIVEVGYPREPRCKSGLAARFCNTRQHHADFGMRYGRLKLVPTDWSWQFVIRHPMGLSRHAKFAFKESVDRALLSWCERHG